MGGGFLLQTVFILILVMLGFVQNVAVSEKHFGNVPDGKKKALPVDHNHMVKITGGTGENRKQGDTDEGREMGNFTKELNQKQAGFY